MFFSPLEIHKQPEDESTKCCHKPEQPPREKKGKKSRTVERRWRPPSRLQGLDGVETSGDSGGGGGRRRGCRIDPMVSVIAARVLFPHAVAHNGVSLGDVL